MDFLAGTGEMAQRIRNHDWQDHPFGPPDTWPQTLRSALSIALNSAFPTAIYWGPELRLLYNDAWSPIPGPRHPEALGARAEDVWSDIWHIIQPQFAELIGTGQGLFLEDQLLPMRRYGFEEETYWNYSFTPLRAEDGRIVGIFNSGSETTEKVIQARNAEGLVVLNQKLRDCDKADDALALSLSHLGGLLNADRVGMLDRVAQSGREGLTLTKEWCAAGVAATDDDLAFFPPDHVQRLMTGRVVQLSLADPDLAADDRDFLTRKGVSGVLAVPWTEQGQVVSVLYLHAGEAIRFHAVNVGTVEKVLETTMFWLDRERHREREKVMAAEIDHRARNMLAVVQSITRMAQGTDVADIKAKLSDRFTALSRVHSLLGRKRWITLEFRDLVEDELAPLGQEISDRITLSGPRIVLKPQQAQLFAMILHELTTNAMKYGSISHDAGRLSVAWSNDTDGSITLDWVETGGVIGRDAELRDSAGGFGSVLLTNLVETQMGGSVERVLGDHGITYRFVLPLNRTSRVASARPVSEDVQNPEKRPLSVMVVEDDAIISLDLADLMTSEGHHVFGQFSTVTTALDALQGELPDIALLDANLCSESSAPVAEALSARRVPFIVVSGNGGGFPEGDARTAAPLIEKPISNAELMSAVQHTLN
ncbi:hypothetical protein BOO69_07170 [Sulfitobacter alexandrii]|uniref:histidine kinase n=2 Tax=Sulfitobacter alexandrii TaxID=1917485 RepID=A0A1J0WFX8_9RHOB|nr:hypothetical protein BOO69_07170 [Sulfitobacter alexandrii]